MIGPRMKEAKRIDFPPLNGRLHSLCWAGNQLVDYGGGIIRYQLGAEGKQRWGGFGSSFDGAINFREGKYAIVYQRLGTKALILKDDEIVREISRSYYCAEVYEYPIAIFNGTGEKVLIAHCPEKYNQLEIEEIETGDKLSTRETKSADFFHSQLEVSPDGRHLLSAGWVWHPWDVVGIYDLSAVRSTPVLLDKAQDNIPGIQADEISSASFLTSSRIVYAGQKEDEAKNFLGVYDLATKETLSEVPIEQPGGVLMPLGDYVVSFFEHPKVLEIATGKVIHTWNDISCGNKHGSIIHHLGSLPKLALDPLNSRFAVGDKERITVIELDRATQ